MKKGPQEARSMLGSTMIGTGLTPEGIFQNDVMYEFMNENAWRKSPRNISHWISNYAIRRYGSYDKNVDKAWQLLKVSYCFFINNETRKNSEF